MAAKVRRMEMRLTPEHKELLERAAEASGQPLTAFALSILIERAHEVLDRESRTILSRRDFDAFLKIIEDDREPSNQLKAALKRYRKVRRA